MYCLEINSAARFVSEAQSRKLAAKCWQRSAVQPKEMPDGTISMWPGLSVEVQIEFDDDGMLTRYTFRQYFPAVLQPDGRYIVAVRSIVDDLRDAGVHLRNQP